jgi:hypothetical protein
MEDVGIEPTTFRMQSGRSAPELNPLYASNNYRHSLVGFAWSNVDGVSCAFSFHLLFYIILLTKLVNIISTLKYRHSFEHEQIPTIGIALHQHHTPAFHHGNCRDSGR